MCQSTKLLATLNPQKKLTPTSRSTAILLSFFNNKDTLQLCQTRIGSTNVDNAPVIPFDIQSSVSVADAFSVPSSVLGYIQDQSPYTCIAHRGRLTPLDLLDPENTSAGSYHHFPCCSAGLTSPGCRLFPRGHDYGCTPSRYAAPPAPAGVGIRFKARRALALDCEMGGVGRMSELIEVVVIDYLTGEALMNTLVQPVQGYEIDDFRTRFSGVKPAAFHRACRNGLALRGGWPAARQKIFQFMDRNTILIGHNIKEDLRVLHIAHDRIVDSQLLVQQLTGAGVGLKKILTEAVGRDIQNRGKAGHDCMEDVVAVREAVIWIIERRGNTQQWLDNLKAIQDEKRRVALEKRKEKEALLLQQAAESSQVPDAGAQQATQNDQ